ncbi:hypothetical protein E6H32_07225 [Candidatus Bathyarchaeota archaeon]|nr:MAG: hypothetical protein E6H32_07225 [Candidatus Bathyarchaeota archaeon]
MTSKARKNKPTRIEKVLPLGKIIEFFRHRFHDPYLNPEAELSFADFQTGFPEVPREDLEEGLSHWVMRPGARVLSTKTTAIDGLDLQVWYIHGLHEEHADLEDSLSRGPIQA